MDDQLFAETARRIFRDLADPQAIAIAAPDDDRWKAPLWRALEDGGLVRAWVPEALNGSGARLADGFELLQLAGSFAVAVPLAETLLAGWLLASAGLAVPDGPLTVAPVCAGQRLVAAADGTLSGRATSVPFARDAGHVAVIAHRGPGAGERLVGLVERRHAELQTRHNLAGEPRDALTFAGAPAAALAPAPAGVDEDRLSWLGATARANQMAGALGAILARSVAYAGERVAFERPIGKFQAVQHMLARLAGETAAALAAAGSAADALDGVALDGVASDAAAGDDGTFLEVAAAKIRVAEAAAAGAAIAHQVHGAIGFSTEHALSRYTRRLWAWRDDFGAESVWAARLGQKVAAAGADALWPLLASR
jgi:acyl-CoA dehydrogenase